MSGRRRAENFKTTILSSSRPTSYTTFMYSPIIDVLYSLTIKFKLKRSWTMISICDYACASILKHVWANAADVDFGLCRCQPAQGNYVTVATEQEFSNIIKHNLLSLKSKRCNIFNY